MIYLLTGSEEEAAYCAHLFGLRSIEWDFASQITERSTGSLWLFGGYFHNPFYQTILDRASIIQLEKVNKNQ